MKDQVLTIEQIEAKFDAQWVLIEDPHTDVGLEVQRARSAGTARIAMRCTAKPSSCAHSDSPSFIPARCPRTPRSSYERTFQC